MTKPPFLIAIDGPSASGKGSLSRVLAERFGFGYLDTGKLYRFAAKHIIDQRVDVDDVDTVTKAIGDIDFKSLSLDAFLHTVEVSKYASKIATYESVRELLNVLQYRFPNDHRGAVIDGRDIGTVIFPDANLKFFITASTEARAQRRYKQLQNEQNSVEYGAVLKDLIERDNRDSGREASPMKIAKDAIIVDTTLLDAQSTLDLVYTLSYKYVDQYFNSQSISGS